jgi:hypothetical protein
MYKVAQRHFFISKGIKFAPGDEITEKAFSSEELFLKEVEAEHIVRCEDKADGGRTGGQTDTAKKAWQAAVKAATKKKEAAAEDQKAQREKAVAALEETLAKNKADGGLSMLEGRD